VETNSTGGQGSGRAVAPSDDDEIPYLQAVSFRRNVNMCRAVLAETLNSALCNWKEQVIARNKALSCSLPERNKENHENYRL
jgi:hypothetical protein